MHSSCALCRQFAAILQEFEGSGGLLLLCRRRLTNASDSIVNSFIMSINGLNRYVLLFPTKSLLFRCEKLRLSPLELNYSWPEDIVTDVLPEQPLCSRAPDYERLKAWIWQCCTEHKATCGIGEGHRPRPDRVIDCETQELCTNEEDYVCLSYIWGASPNGADRLGKSLPHNLPLTIRDAMIVTLRIGLRYLWVDRYCIDQNNADEKHNIIKNMNAICEYTACLRQQ
jgi:hypothetical protein